MRRFAFISIFITTTVFFVGAGLLATPEAVQAQEEPVSFVPLVGLPFVDEFGIDESKPGLAGYANVLYRVAITVAAILAVIKIVMAGVQYMLTDVVPQKSQAKKNIRTALLGLVIVVGAVLILNTINPRLTNLEVLNLKQLEGEVSTVSRDFFGDPKIEEMCTTGYGCKIEKCSGYVVSYETEKFGTVDIISLDYDVKAALDFNDCPGWCEDNGGIWGGNTSRTCTLPKSSAEFSGTDELISCKDTTCSSAIENCEAYEDYLNHEIISEDNIVCRRTSVLTSKDRTNITYGSDVTFDTTILDTPTVIEMTQTKPQLKDIPKEDIVGVLTANWFSPEGISTLENAGYEVGEQEKYEEEIITPACGDKNTLIRTESGGISDTTFYFCIKQ